MSSSLYYQISNVWIVVAIACCILLALSLRSYTRIGSAVPWPRRILFLMLRIGSIALVLFLLADPHRISRETFREPREIAVLVDASKSMAFTDTPGQTSRWKEAREFIDSVVARSGVSENFRLYTFGSQLKAVPSIPVEEPTDTTSHFSTAIDELLNQPREVPLGAVVVVSDGQFADPVACANTALKLRRAGIPLFFFGSGTEVEEPDVRIEGANGYQVIPFEPRLRLDLTLLSPGFTDRETTVSIRREGRLLYERKIQLNGSQQDLSIDFDSPFQGFHEYTVSVSEQPGERLSGNNEFQFGADLRDEKIRVVYMEGTDNASHTLESALEEDPHIEVTSLYFPQNRDIESAKKFPYRTDAEGRRVYNVAHPDRGFPVDMESLLEYDVIINSDIYREAFTPEQLENTVALVEEFGGGFVMVGGSTAFGAGFYDKTVIDKLMPVDVYGNTDSQYGNFHLDIPDAAYSHPIMKVGSTDAETRTAWEDRFPGFGGLNLVNRLKPGAVSLALHDKKKNQYGPLVVFAVQQIGRGRTMAFTSDTTYGWGAAFETTFGTSDDPIAYYRQFWNNAIRWLAADRIQRKSGELKIEIPGNRIRVGRELPIDVVLATEKYDASVRLKVILPNEDEIDLPLDSNSVDGHRTTIFSPTQIGPHRFVAQLEKQEGKSLFSRRFVAVVSDDREQETTQSNTELLSKLAKNSNGQFSHTSNSTFDASVLGDLSAEFIEYREASIWDRWWFLILLVSMLGLEWYLRRKWGMA